MSKIIAITILTMMALVPTATRTLSTPETPPDEMDVKVQFSGLMVFNENPHTKAYEVGILDSKHAKGHQFCIHGKHVPRVCRDRLPQSTKWSLTLTNPPGGTNLAIGHDNKRRPDHRTGQYDFDWIVTLDGPEFHGTKLNLAPGNLRPIIQLPKVSLSTGFKSPDFVRWQGQKPPDPAVFGFVAETIEFNVKLKRGEQLILKDTKSGKQIFAIPSTPDSWKPGDYDVITISNVRYPPSEKSDFTMYYHLFPAVPKNKRFDFHPNTKEGKQVPFNLFPRYGKETCCSMDCTAIHLTQWGKALH